MPPLIPLTNPNTVTADGQIVTAAVWDNNFSSIVNYINNSLTASFNVVSSKGDIYAYDGTNIQALSANGITDGWVLSKNSSAPFGVQWVSPPGLPTTTNGDLIYFNGSNQRLPIGSTNQVLTVVSGLPAWSNSAVGIPSGCILLWSGSIATIPSGWALCNGMNGTPNLQGYFVVGAGNSSPGGTNGMGLINPNTQGGDASSGPGVGASYSPTVSGSVSGTTNSNNTNTNINGGVSPAAAANGHTHTFSANFTTTTNSFVVTPVYYALAYIMKL